MCGLPRIRRPLRSHYTADKEKPVTKVETQKETIYKDPVTEYK
jgi:hypothetical protein